MGRSRIGSDDMRLSRGSSSQSGANKEAQGDGERPGPTDYCLMCAVSFTFTYFHGRDFEGVYMWEEESVKKERFKDTGNREGLTSRQRPQEGKVGQTNWRQDRDTSPLRKEEIVRVNGGMEAEEFPPYDQQFLGEVRGMVFPWEWGGEVAERGVR